MSTDVALRVTVRSVGTLFVEREIAWLYPFIGVTVKVDTPVAPAVRVRVERSGTIVKSGVGVHVLDETA
jgi:hypothetical protein